VKPGEIDKEVEVWADGIGMTVRDDDTANAPDLQEALRSNASDMELLELEVIIDRLSAYAVYLHHQRGLVASRLRLLENEYEYQVNSESEKLTAQKGRFRSHVERQALVVRKNGALQKTRLRIARLRAKYDRITELPRAVDNRVAALRDIYKKRIYEQREG